MIIRSSTIGDVLRTARRDCGMSQSDLAPMLGISIFVLSRVEGGTRAFDTDWVERMPLAIGVAVKDALSREIRYCVPLMKKSA